MMLIAHGLPQTLKCLPDAGLGFFKLALGLQYAPKIRKSNESIAVQRPKGLR